MMSGRVAAGRGRTGRVRGSLAAVFLGFTVLMLAACAGEPKELPYVETPVEDLYNKALEELEKRNWQLAARRFDEVERQHPYSVWARRAMLMGAYAHYENNKYDEAILAARRFIQLHPGNRDAPYAYYLIAISFYEQISDVPRDQRITEAAMTTLQEVILRFPESEYARDARLKLDMTLDHLAGKEMYVGRYYLRRNQHLAAINRFRNVVANYQTTSHVPEALHRLVESYMALGIVDEAMAAAAVLGHNYPGSKWYEDSYTLLTRAELQPQQSGTSWLSRLSFGTF
jgi:outer membrane protein assembly factor BamD